MAVLLAGRTTLVGQPAFNNTLARDNVSRGGSWSWAGLPRAHRPVSATLRQPVRRRRTRLYRRDDRPARDAQAHRPGVQGDINGDKKADFEIRVETGSLVKGDFLL
jgi:hypothetical protein